MNPNSTTAAAGLANYDSTVQDLRTQINILDDQIASLLKARLQLVFETREVKQIDGIPQHCAERENVVVKNVTFGADGLEKEFLQEVYTSLLAVTRRVADQKQLQ